MVASRNQGNCSNGRNRSFPATYNQKPCAETLVTSAVKVLFPRLPDCRLMGLYQLVRDPFLAGTPDRAGAELWPLAREEEQPVGSDSKDGRAQDRIIRARSAVRHVKTGADHGDLHASATGSVAMLLRPGRSRCRSHAYQHGLRRTTDGRSHEAVWCVDQAPGRRRQPAPSGSNEASGTDSSRSRQVETER